MNIEAARHALTSPAIEESLSAMETIAACGSLSDLQPLINLTRSENPRIRPAAIQATKKLILGVLLTRYHELDHQLREKLGAILDSLQSTVFEEIAREVFSKNEKQRLRAVQVLGLMRKNPGLQEVLAKLLQDHDSKVRATAVLILGKVISPTEHTVIMALLNDPDKRVRANAIEALEGLGNKRLVPILMRFRKDPNNRIRANVIKALHSLGFTEIEGDLMEMLDAHDDFLNASALWVVSSIKISTSSIENACGRFMLSDNDMVLRNARKALATLSTPRSKGFMTYLGDVSSLFAEKRRS